MTQPTKITTKTARSTLSITVTPLALSLLAVTLVGCGGDDNGIYGPGIGSNNNELTITQFDRSSNAVARIDTTYRRGERDVKKTNVVGSYDQSIDNLPSSVVLSDKFEGSMEDKNISVSGRTVTRPVYEKNSNNRFDYKTTYKTYNLAGKRADSYRRGVGNNKSIGVFTDLNNYAKIPPNATFPSGSVCYVPVESTERSFFSFNQNQRTGYLTLDEWTEAAKKQFGDNRASKTTFLNVGAGNGQTASQVEFFATNNEPEYLYNGVEYNKVIYNANFVGKNQAAPNQNDTTGVIDCTIVNKVAADFLAKQIADSYRP